MASTGLQSIKDLDAKLDRSSADAAAKVLKELPLSLPAGDYQVEIKGKTLHIYGTTAGISKFAFTDPAKLADQEFGPEGVTLSVKGFGKVDTIFLHSSKTKPDPNAISQKALPALPFLDEFKELSQKTYDDEDDPQRAIDRTRMAELLQKIKEAYAKPAEDEEAKKKAAKKLEIDDTPPAPRVSRPPPPRKPPPPPPPSVYSNYGRSSG